MVGSMSMEEMATKLAALEAQNAALVKASNSALKMKVGKSGGVSVYGLGRFPVTLYASQWEKLLANAEAIKSFIEANKASLSFK